MDLCLQAHLLRSGPANFPALYHCSRSFYQPPGLARCGAKDWRFVTTICTPQVYMIRYWAAGKGMADEQRVGQLTGLLVGDSDDLRADLPWLASS